MTATADPTLRAILARSDAGERIATISASLAIKPGQIYATLREHRPKRKRSPRTLTSDVPNQVRGLRGLGMDAPRIAKVLGCSKAYVYRILA